MLNPQEDNVVPLSDPEYILEVSDSGIGIAKDRLPLIFDAFTQEDTSITRRYGGTGLGLSIIKQLIELMGGRIDVKSKVGQGSRFIIHLPLEEVEDSDLPIEPLNRTDLSSHQEPLNVLLAEDNDVNAMIASAFLEKLGHSVTHVENGRLAADKVFEGGFDIVLMDVHMPEMDGIEATEIIRASSCPDKAIPIIGLTAEAFAERLAVFRKAGMDQVITKPFTEDQLKTTLHRAVTSDRKLAIL